MKSQAQIIICFLLVGTLIGCTDTKTQCELCDITQDDLDELALAKKTIECIQDNKREDLMSLLHKNILRGIDNPEQLDWLFENMDKRIIESNDYPPDSIIFVSYINRKSLLREKRFKEFIFPFI